MGCLKFIIRSTFIILFLCGAVLFYAFGGIDWAKYEFNSIVNPTEKLTKDEAQKVADFSKIPNGYKLDKTVNMFGIKAVVAENQKNNQKLALVDPGWVFKITKDDVKSNKIDDQLNQIAQRFSKVAKLDDLIVTKKGAFNAMGQTVPYVKVNINSNGNKKQSFESIVGVVTTPDHKDNLVVSANEPGKYNEGVSEKFFKSLKFNK